MGMNERKIIQIAAAGVENTYSTQCSHITTALCDDGTVWEIHDNSQPIWRQLPPIPQYAVDTLSPVAADGTDTKSEL